MKLTYYTCNKQRPGFAGKIDTNALASNCTWRISLACSRRQYDRGDRVTRNGERREKAEERKMIEQLLSPPPPAFFLHIFLCAVSTILEQTGFISFR